jgi:hypothetical protein
MRSSWVFWRQSTALPLDNSIQNASAWRLRTTQLENVNLVDAVWIVNGISFFTSPDCNPDSILSTKLANGTIQSGFLRSQDGEWIPYNAFDSNATTGWASDPSIGWIIGYDFGTTVTVECIVLNQGRDSLKYVNSTTLEGTYE